MKVDRGFVKLLFLQIILVTSLAYMIGTGMKLIFAEPRPCELLEMCPESYSFPSRHAAVAFAGATIVSLLFRKVSYSALVFALAAAVGYWRIAIGFHTFNDVWAGAVLGMSVGLGVHYLLARLRARRRPVS